MVILFKTLDFKKSQPYSIMENIINNPGLQHITEKILINLEFPTLKTCSHLNKSCINEVLANPLFLLRKLNSQRRLSQKNYTDWVKAIQLTKNTNVEANIKLYLEKVIKIGHFVDVPCFIDSDAVERSTEFTFEKAREEMNLGVLQILAAMKDNPNEKVKLETTLDPTTVGLTPIAIAAINGHLNIIKILAPITKYPNIGRYIFTPIFYAACIGHIDIFKYVVPLNTTEDQLRIIASNLRYPYHRNHEFINILESYINK